MLSGDLLFQLTFYPPNCGPNEYKVHHENDTILLGYGEDHENLYLGVDSNVFKYRWDNNGNDIVIYEAYQELEKLFLHQCGLQFIFSLSVVSE